ncbi:MAG: hypothetical protein PUH58_08250 [Sphaerochaetaceae bacterium]|nr:hypothetical protein [Sphaerochaetaceae bacterium]
MKKSRIFIFILALMSTLLMAVACDSAPTPDNLVPASVSLDGEGRGLVITGGDGTVTKYNIALIPEWDNGTYGEEICGMIGSRNDKGVVTYGASYDSNVSNINLGYITMGKWTVYVQALNKNGNIIYEGNTSTYFSHSSTNVVVLLHPVKNGGRVTLDYFIVLPQLCETFEEHKEHYSITISVKDISSSSFIYEKMEITPSTPKFSSVGVPELLYSSWDDVNVEKAIELYQGTYLVTVILNERENANTDKFKVIGGISRTINIVPGEGAIIKGYVTPSDFISPDLEIPASTINASMTGPEGSQKKETPLTFVCTDVGGKPGEYDRTFHWFIEGEEITDSTKVSTDNATGQSILKYSFNEYGRWDVTCKIVYSPSSPNAVSFCGEASYTVQIVP